MAAGCLLLSAQCFATDYKSNPFFSTIQIDTQTPSKIDTNIDINTDKEKRYYDFNKPWGEPIKDDGKRFNKNERLLKKAAKAKNLRKKIKRIINPEISYSSTEKNSSFYSSLKFKNNDESSIKLKWQKNL